MTNMNNRINMNNNHNFLPNMYQQMSHNGGSNYDCLNYVNVGGSYQNVGINNPYVTGGGPNSHINYTPYNMNLINKGYPQNDFKRISLDKEKQQNFDLNITDVNGMIFLIKKC